MANQNQIIKLNIGDEIGFVRLADESDSADRVIYFKVAEITERDGERAYRYQYPDGEVSRSAIRQSELAAHVVRVKTAASPDMICLTERSEEFFTGLGRANDSDLEVFTHWDRDDFVVVNRETEKEYRIFLKSVEGKPYASCECADFLYRKRICKHISAVLTDRMIGAFSKV